MNGRIETAGYFFNCVGNFTQRRTVMGCLYGQFQKVTVVTAFCRFGDSFQIACYRIRITDASQFFQTFNLCITYSRIIDGKNVQRIFLSQTVLIQADNGFFTAVDVSLTASRTFFDTHFRKTGGNSFCHSAQGFDFLNVAPSTTDNLVCQIFYIVGTAPGIDNLAGFGFILDIELCITSQTCGEVGRKCDSFVQCVGMQRLGMSESCRHSFHTGTCNVIERILFCQ